MRKKSGENLRSRIPFINPPTREMEKRALSVVRANTSDSEFPEILQMVGLSHLIDA